MKRKEHKGGEFWISKQYLSLLIPILYGVEGAEAIAQKIESTPRREIISDWMAFSVRAVTPKPSNFSAPNLPVETFENEAPEDDESSALFDFFGKQN